MQSTTYAVLAAIIVVIVFADRTITYNGHTYKRVDGSKSFNDALAAARALGPGWDLASIQDYNEQHYLAHNLIDVDYDQSGLKEFIIGGYCTSAGVFHWTDGSPWVYAAWWGGEPNGGCTGEFNTAFDSRYGSDWFWNDYDGRTAQSYVYGFIAEYAASYCCPSVSDECNSIGATCSDLATQCTSLSTVCADSGHDQTICDIANACPTLSSICTTMHSNCLALISNC